MPHSKGNWKDWKPLKEAREFTFVRPLKKGKFITDGKTKKIKVPLTTIIYVTRQEDDLGVTYKAELYHPNYCSSQGTTIAESIYRCIKNLIGPSP